ncbi:MAG: gamma-glutamyl-gamma-aminobutyrate hydrolase family protein [Nitrospirae bacterium]|nr:gamma-glutamyl-gamma-aminobutyrate hydrolase family protein [Nitrospirota bacterium]
MFPIIAITAKTEELRNRQQVTLPEAYGKAIENAGGVPVILPIISHKSNITSIARFADGYLFSGGDDIRPGYYGEEQILDLTLSPDERTEFEIALLNEVIRLKKPVLGVCLGAQLINVALGGSLYQDIPTQIPAPLDHRSVHNVLIKKGTLLYRIFNTPPPLTPPSYLPPHGGEGEQGFSGEIPVISAHHQAIKSSGKGLIDSALSPDGVIEAVEMTDYPFLIGVQWHPERSPEDEYTQKLFEAFIDSARNI